jgi:hypothetical protein
VLEGCCRSSRRAPGATRFAGSPISPTDSFFIGLISIVTDIILLVTVMHKWMLPEQIDDILQSRRSGSKLAADAARPLPRPRLPPRATAADRAPRFAADEAGRDLELQPSS